MPRSSEIVFPAALEPAEDTGVETVASTSWGWLEWFTLSQVLWGVLLFVPGSQAYRAYIRAFPYAMSLVALAACARAQSTAWVPGSRWMLAVLGLLVVNLARPETWLYSGLAQVGFQLAIAAPVFWAARFELSDSRLDRLLWLIFAANFVASLIGLLQVYFPDRFLPPEFTSLGLQLSPSLVGELTYIGADGRPIVRPPGLSDLPGGAAISGTIAALLSFGLSVRTDRPYFTRACYLLCAGLCITVVYLTHVRSLLLIILGCMGIVALLRLRQGHVIQSTWITAAAAALVLGAFVWAVSLGGEAVSTRFSAIAETGVVQTFQQNRGHFLQYTLEEGLSEYPFGAGLGRWGMMSVYFGGGEDWRYPALYAEIQLTGWLYDGGILMWLFYGGAVGVALRYSYRLAMSGAGLLSECAVMILCVQLFVATLCLAGPAFNTQLGILFWLVTSILHGAHRTAVWESVEEDAAEGSMS